MMKRIDNIVIGELVEGVTLEMLGVCDDEVTIHISEDDAREANFFLPRLLVDAGVFTNTSEVRRIQKDRTKMGRLSDDERILWRELKDPELTKFKVGKKLFWLIAGEFTV
ncbi:MAG: hypothetical protein DRQ98_12505 [Gammaproteobacteria bacterium]|nr:MAG: hypothetical protein DRQ98_12505 [Gammaproteobacteria bacterium]